MRYEKFYCTPLFEYGNLSLYPNLGPYPHRLRKSRSKFRMNYSKVTDTVQQLDGAQVGVKGGLKSRISFADSQLSRYTTISPAGGDRNPCTRRLSHSSFNSFEGVMKQDVYGVVVRLLPCGRWLFKHERLEHPTEKARTAEEITHTYTDEVPPPDNIFILSNSASALQAVKNPRSIKAHSSALRFHCALTTFTLCHSHVAFYLVWSPADGDLEGFRMASTWAAAACPHDPPNGLDRVQSAAFQKD
jgi:hypothetical protein